MSCLPVSVLVVAKAPEPGRVKTRLAAAIGDKVAADIAAAALLDTLDAVAAAPVTARAVALTGDLDSRPIPRRSADGLSPSRYFGSAVTPSPTGSPTHTSTRPTAIRCCRSGWTRPR